MIRAVVEVIIEIILIFFQVLKVIAQVVVAFLGLGIWVLGYIYEWASVAFMAGRERASSGMVEAARQMEEDKNESV